MRLITVQPIAVMSQLARGERVYGRPQFDLTDPADVSIQRAYTWLSHHMDEMSRLDDAGPVCFPMWSWVVPPKGVDAFLPIQPEPFDYVLHLEVPDHLIVCTDYDMWHHVLNGHSIQLYENEAIHVEESWERVFGVDPKTYSYTLDSPDRDYMDLDSPPTIQATTWYIDPTWIVKTVPHTKGRSCD